MTKKKTVKDKMGRKSYENPADVRNRVAKLCTVTAAEKLAIATLAKVYGSESNVLRAGLHVLIRDKHSDIFRSQSLCP